MDDVRALKRAVTDLGAIAASCFPSGTQPQIPINGKQMYPFYAACVELDVPMFINAGVPGPRFPMLVQHVEHLDEVCYDFPELTIVMRHGAEPWDALAVKLMLKWPGLHYSTSAFAPKHYPESIIKYANTRGADKVLYAGYFPMGLSLEPSCPRCPSRTTSGPSSCTRTHGASSSWPRARAEPVTTDWPHARVGRGPGSAKAGNRRRCVTRRRPYGSSWGDGQKRLYRDGLRADPA
jgi:hypothetical protein